MMVIGIFAVTLILNHVGVPEVEASEEGVKCQEVTTYLREFLSRPMQFLLVTDSYLINLLFLNLIFWLPYYLMKVAGSHYVTIILVAWTFMMIGSFAIDCLISISRPPPVTIAFLAFVFVFHVYLIIVPEGSESFLHYLIIFSMVFFFVGGQVARIQVETVEYLGNDPLKKSIIINFALLVKEVLCALVFLLNGHFM